MKTAFTPGPWVVSDHYQPSDAPAVIGADGFPVATTKHTAIREDYEALGFRHWADGPGQAYITRPETEFQANAALIAAAPELYEALDAQETSWLHHRSCPECQMLSPLCCDEGGDIDQRAYSLITSALARARGEEVSG